MAFVIRAVTKGISTGLGLAGEKYYDHKERKAALAEGEESGNPSSSASDVDQSLRSQNPAEQADESADDERIWALDEAGGDPPPSYEATESQNRPTQHRTVSDLVHDTVSVMHHDSPGEVAQKARLPYPVIIPQRRPGTKTRGFARAYPPDLDAMIDQETFLKFLHNFDEASAASPWLNALFISAGAIGFVPSHITLAVSISVQFAAGTAIELQSRYKANAFLDQMNKDLFMPLGLYCMILMCKDGPGSAEHPVFGYETVNLDTATAKQITKWGLPKQNEDDEYEISKKNKALRSIRLTSGRIKQSDMPLEIAPLIYPGLEDMIERPAIKRDERFKDRLLRNKDFVADYFDRRAQADYTGNNPDSTLTKASSPETQFRTRFADPNHPCNNGHLFSLVTGGRYVAQPLGRRRGMLRQVGEDGKLKPKPKVERPVRGPISLVAKGVRKVLAKNILYLTIVNLPSEEELAEARKMMEVESESGGFKSMFQGSKGAQGVAE